MANRLQWTLEAWDDYIYCQTQDRKTLRRINRLVRATLENPHSGIGKPEALKGDLSGFWSRRIDHSNRLVYVLKDDVITILSCRYHY